MTGPEFSAAEPEVAPNYAATAAPSSADFGPDENAGEAASPFENLTGRTRIPRKTKGAPSPRSVSDTFGKLGTNKKTRSPVRKLTSTDRDKIATLYTFGSMGLMPFRPEAAEVMANSADKCADAWMELAEQNDSVRRTLLALLEGGVWGKVFAAHLPILVALIPTNALPPMFRNMTVPDYPPTDLGDEQG